MRGQSSIATAPGCVKGFGHALQLLRDPQRFLTALPAHGNLVRVRLGAFTAIVICDPELTRHVLVETRTFDKGGMLVRRLREVFGDSLPFCEREEHRRQRRLVKPAFHPARFATYAGTMAREIDASMRSWRDCEVLDVPDAMRGMTTRVMLATIADIRGSADVQQITDDFQALQRRAFKRMLLPPSLDWAPVVGNRPERRTLARLRRAFGEVIEERRRTGPTRDDLVSILVAARDDDATGAPDDEINDQLRILYFAGTDTTAATTSWLFHVLSRHPDIQERLHREVAPLAGAIPAIDDIPKLTYTRRVINETLRMYPPGWFFTRTTTAGTQLGGHAIPAGSTIIFSPYLIHRLPSQFPRPERFDPDRWHEDAPAPAAFLPFGGGARRCIGDTFAMLQITQILAAVVGRWELEAVAGSSLRPVRRSVLSPIGLRVRIHARPQA